MCTAPFSGIDRGLWASKNSISSDTLIRDPKELHYVFLEGSAGVGKGLIADSSAAADRCSAGKTTLTTKLQKMGYTVHFEGFIDLCKANPQYPPTSTLMTLKWSQGLLAAMEDSRLLHAQAAPAAFRLACVRAGRARTRARANRSRPAQQGRIKDGVMFFDRSLLTPAIYARGAAAAAAAAAAQRGEEDAGGDRVLRAADGPLAEHDLHPARPTQG